MSTITATTARRRITNREKLTRQWRKETATKLADAATKLAESDQLTDAAGTYRLDGHVAELTDRIMHFAAAERIYREALIYVEGELDGAAVAEIVADLSEGLPEDEVRHIAARGAIDVVERACTASDLDWSAA